MASLNSEHHHGQQPTKLARQNSSFLGAIKNIVTAPLNWFGNPGEDETSGKRRRPLEQVPTEPSLSMDVSMDDDIDDTTRRSKRMRLHSPPTRTQHYLDPPADALRNDKMTRRTSVVPRASSAVLPSTRSGRATLSPHRRGPLSRTMSIDPPHLPPRRDASFNFAPPRSADVDISMSSIQDMSMPPSPRSPRPSFRMRASLTPQPQQLPRHISEPPPLNSLVSNPHFVQPPPSSAVEPKPVPTLGTLVESVRTVRSPTRHQHASLLLGPDAPTKNAESKEDPAQRALSQLDVYKTPLLPTRLRSSNLPASVIATKTPDMFKSKRSSHLVLMQDDRDRLGRKGTSSSKSPVVNDTKPYAGEGGMKKLLARRKVEAEDDENETKSTSDDMGDAESVSTRQPSPPPVPKVPVPSSSDWFSVASSSAPSSGSSLRVGRTKTSRNHITRPSRARFSAVYEDEGDDAMDDDREKDRKMLEEAAKKAPVFQIPEGFSFAKDAPVPTGDLAKAKEPPIASLPFSFAKPSTAISAPAVPIAPPKVETKAAEPESRPVQENESSQKATASSSISAFSFDAKSSSSAPTASQGGIPNFFAKSEFLAKAPPPPVPAPLLNFGAPTPAASEAPAQSFLFGQPLKDRESPFWDGEKKSQPMAKEPTNTTAASSERSETSNASSLFPSAPPSMAPSSQPVKETPAISTSSPFSFGGTLDKKSETAPAPSPSIAPVSVPATSAFGTGQQAKPADIPVSAPKPLFGGLPAFGEIKPPSNSTLFGGPTSSSSAPAPFSFGTSNTANPAPVSSAPAPFSFGGSIAPSPAPEVPKPSGFSMAPNPTGNAPAPFSFNTVSSSDKGESKPSGFSFGAPAASAEVKAAPAPFSFGQPTVSAPAPAPAPPAFSFSGSTVANADGSSKSPFSFGQSSTSSNNAMDSDIGRPVTPPKNSDQEFRMEESPTRDLQQVNKPPMNGGFSFSTGTSSSTSGNIFGGDRAGTASPLPTSAPFSFGAPSTSNAFGSKESKPFSFGNAAAAPAPITTSFSFGQPAKASEEPARPLTGGGFSFNATPTSTTAPAPAFSFGPSASSGFNLAPSSAPSSPSTFNQPTGFSFGNPAPAASSPFSFGSQPASPAGGASLTLPQPATGGFGSSSGGFGQPGTPQPSSPFSAPAPLAPSTSSGGTLFTIGAAPSSAPSAAGARQIKKLPTRRTGAKR